VPAAQPHTSNILYKTTTNNRRGDAVALYVASAKASAHHDQTVATSDNVLTKHATNASDALRFVAGCTIFQAKPMLHGLSRLSHEYIFLMVPSSVKDS